MRRLGSTNLGILTLVIVAIFLGYYFVGYLNGSSLPLTKYSGIFYRGSMSSNSCPVPCAAIIAYYLVFSDGTSALILWKNATVPQLLTNGQQINVNGTRGSIPTGVTFSQNPPPIFAINNANLLSPS